MGTSSNNYSDLVDATEDLKKKGYTSSFKLIEDEKSEDEAYMDSLSTGKRYKSKDLKVREHYRFEGESAPEDMSVIYAVEANTGEKGVIIDGFGTYSTKRAAEFLRSMEIDLDPSQAVVNYPKAT